MAQLSRHCLKIERMAYPLACAAAYLPARAVTTGSGVPAYLLSTLRPLAAVIARGWALQPRAMVL